MKRPFGEGAQQKTFELPDGAALILSIAKYETPSGKKIEDEGITPDFQVASAADEAPVSDDDSDGAPAAATPAPTKSSVQVDEQLTKAIPTS